MKLIIVISVLCCSVIAHASIFPITKKTLTYSMVYSPINDGGDILEGELDLKIISVKISHDEVVTEFVEHSTPFPKLKFFKTIEKKGELLLKGATFIGPGSDTIPDQFAFMPLPMSVGSKIDNPIMLSRVKDILELEVLGQIRIAKRVSMIGTYGQFYTMVGNYWIVNGLGIVAANYTTVDGWNVSLKLKNLK